LAISPRNKAKFKGREWEAWSHGMSAWLLRDFDELKSFDAYMASSDPEPVGEDM
jgi:hypothetical protein